MNCDKVFEILTRGPFPAGAASDEAVEIHLSRCPQCRRLAEALRPSLETLQESISPEEGRILPGYRGEIFRKRSRTESTGDLAVSLGRSSPPTRLERVRWSLRRAVFVGSGLTLLRFTAAVVLGIVLGAALRTVMAPDESTRSTAGHAVTAFPSAANSTAGSNTAGSRVAGDGRRGALRAVKSERAVSPWSAQRQAIVTLNLPTVCLPKRSSFPEQPVANDSAADTVRVLLPHAEELSQQCCTHCHRETGTVHLADNVQVQLFRSCKICHAGLE